MAAKPITSLTHRIRRIIKCIPFGKVATYGQVARLAGDPRGARQVAWILASSSRKENLPWHRVINSRGAISLPRGAGFEEQKIKLLEENVKFKQDGSIDLEIYRWHPR